MVVISHGTPGSIRNWLIFPIWIDQAVPIFLLIQTFHAYKHQIVRYPTIIKLWKRIILPFFIIQMLFIIYYYVHSIYKESDFIVSMLNLLASGGKGQGSYYIWVYIQMAIALPLFQHLVRRRCALVFFIGLSIASEIICSLFKMPEYIYRLVFIRYLFIIYLGYLWARDGIVMTSRTMILSIISIIAIIVLYYLHLANPDFSFQPLIFNTDWTIFHWFTYFLPWSLLPFAFIQINHRYSNTIVNKVILLIGKRSYEIFLFQMLVYAISPLPNIANIIICFFPLVALDYQQLKRLLKHL